MFSEILTLTFLGNTVEDYCWFAAIILFGLVLKKQISRILTQFVFRGLKKYSADIAFEKLWALLKKPTEIFILLVAVYFAFDRLNFPENWKLVPVNIFGVRMIVYRSFQISIILSVTWISLRLVDFLGIVLLQKSSHKESKTDNQLIPFIRESIKLVILIFALFFILGAIFKLNVASLIAGLGIGGLAVALAAKESIENLLGSFTIFLDKPFVIGDQVQIGNISGQVERIGFRSTRIRTVEKTYVTVPNKKMVDGELDNLTLRTQRRAKFSVNLSSNTTAEQLRSIVNDIQNYIDEHTKIDKKESRVRFYELGTGSLNLMVLYFINTADYDTYLNVREEINFKIMETIKKHGSDFASASSIIIQK
jgi:MscS family membrane protein